MELEAFSPRVGLFPPPVISPIISNIMRYNPNRYLLAAEFGDWDGSANFGGYPILIELDLNRMSSPFQFSIGRGHGDHGAEMDIKRILQSDSFLKSFKFPSSHWFWSIIEENKSSSLDNVIQLVLTGYNTNKPEIPWRLKSKLA